MSLIARGLDARDDQSREEAAAEDAWLRARGGVDPDQRRDQWRHWLRKELERTLQWPCKAAAKERLIGQCGNEITTLARQLRGRGWLLEGDALAKHVRELLKPIAAAQKANKIGDFWPYFRAAVARYVGAHAEEIQTYARRSGADESAQTIGGVFAALGIGEKLRQPTGPSLTEILAKRDAEVRRDKAVKAEADAAQMELL